MAKVLKNLFFWYRANSNIDYILLTALAFIIRLPYWQTIPSSGDEVGQTVFAYLIARGDMLPLVANDAYAGPFFVYFLAGLQKLGFTDPMLGKAVMVVAGTLTVPLTYAWTQALNRSRLAALIAAFLVMTSPDLILLNSHLGGATYLLPFLIVLFLGLLTMAINRDHLGLLLGSGVVAGLALQANPIAIIAVIAGLLWSLWKSRKTARLGNHWPFWPFITGLILILIYSPVIVYNINTNLGTVEVLGERSYLWETNPSLATALDNYQRLALQTTRQVSGILLGEESFDQIKGIPLIYLALMFLGLLYTTKRVSYQPAMILIPYLLIMPVFSSHYGFRAIGRFTTFFIPIWAVSISFLLTATYSRITNSRQKSRKLWGPLLTVFVIFLVLYPTYKLVEHISHVNRINDTGYVLLELSRYVVENNNGEAVYISTLEELPVKGLAYVPNTAFTLADINHEYLHAALIIGRIFENPEPAFLLLSDSDAATIGEIFPIERLPLLANELASLKNYSLYHLTLDTAYKKPGFVLSENMDIPNGLSPSVKLGNVVQLLGCEIKQPPPAPTEITLSCYWQRAGDVDHGAYVGFVHLLDPVTGDVVSQDDHFLGQERYPLTAWQDDEIIEETYVLKSLQALPIGNYHLRLGIYSWPDQNRLNVPNNVDNIVELLPLVIEN